MTKEEFENIYRQHYAKMYRLARTMLYDVDESKDVVSDIFARLLRDCDGPQKDKAASKREQSDACISSVEREQARPKAKMEGYLMTAVRNRCRDVLCHKSMQERVEKPSGAADAIHRVGTATAQSADISTAVPQQDEL